MQIDSLTDACHEKGSSIKDVYKRQPLCRGYMDFEQYGQDCMENDCVTKTEFGLLRRFDPPFPVQQQEQRMM